MERNVIFYFTGTGNSLRAANLIAQKIGSCGIVNVAHHQNDKGFVFDGTPERIGFVFPCYAMGLPLIMRQFIKSLDLSSIRSTYIFAVATCGGGAGNCLSQVQEMIGSKRMDLTYGASVKMFSNCITLYKMADNAEQQAIESDNEIKKIADEIATNKKSDIPKSKGMLNIVNKLMSNTFPKRGKNYNVSDTCNSCRKCVEICPAANISLQNGKPEFGDKCVRCVACIQWCPVQAINYKSKTKGMLRYHHPNITFEDIVRS